MYNLDGIKQIKDVYDIIRDKDKEYPRRVSNLEEQIALQIFDIRVLIKNKIQHEFGPYERRENGWDIILECVDSKIEIALSMLKQCNDEQWEIYFKEKETNGNNWKEINTI